MAGRGTGLETDEPGNSDGESLWLSWQVDEDAHRHCSIVNPHASSKPFLRSSMMTALIPGPLASCSIDSLVAVAAHLLQHVTTIMTDKAHLDVFHAAISSGSLLGRFIWPM